MSQTDTTSNNFGQAKGGVNSSSTFSTAMLPKVGTSAAGSEVLKAPQFSSRIQTGQLQEADPLGMAKGRKESEGLYSAAKLSESESIALGQNLPHPKPRPSQFRRLQPTTHKIIRDHLMRTISENLHRISNNYGEPASLFHLREFMETSLQMRDVIPFDPFVEILMALYDALSGDIQKIGYTAQQIDTARDILISASQKTSLSQNSVEKAIFELEKAGFVTLPFELEEEFWGEEDD